MQERGSVLQCSDQAFSMPMPLDCELHSIFSGVFFFYLLLAGIAQVG